MLYHPAFDIDRVGREQVNAVAEVLSALLRSEDHSTLKGIDVWVFEHQQHRGGIRFIATRYGNLWDVDVVNGDWSLMPGFDDML